MEKKNSCARAGFSTILWGVLAILLCAAPCSAKDVISGETLNVGTGYPDVQILNDWLDVYGTLNMYPGAYVDWGIYAYDGSIVNVYAGEVGAGYFIMVFNGANVTVYGTGFADDDGPLDPSVTQWIPTGGSGTLTVTYENGDTINLLFYSSIAINLVNTAGGEEPQIIDIDIKPGSDLNPINPGSNGLIPVAILTTDDFDATTVDPESVSLAGAEVAVRGKAEKLMARLEDVDGDGDLDLLVQVETQSDGALWKSGTVTLTGKTYDGQNIEGADEVIIVPPAE